jgi:hypothetical protein
MTEKIAIFVPPYKLPFSRATLLNQLVKEVESKGYKVILMEHPPNLGSITDLNQRSRDFFERLKKLDLKGKEVLFIGHSLGGFILKNIMPDLLGLVRKPFKVITIGALHSGKAVITEKDRILSRYSTGWEGDRTRFKELSESPNVPNGCRLIEFFSPHDPDLRAAISNPASSSDKSIIRTPITPTKPNPKREDFFTHHLFHGHEPQVVRAVKRHLK